MRVLPARLLVGFFGAVLLYAQTESPVTGVGPFLHIVSDLDQSLAFYQGVLGLQLTGPPGEHKFTDNPAVANLYGVPGKQFRSAVLKIPGSPMGIELVQWGLARKPEHKVIPGPGAVTLILRVTDGKTDGKQPVTQQDPDGFVVESQRSEIAGADLSISVADVSKTAALYTSVFGFKADAEWLAVPGSSVRVRLTAAKDAKGLSIPFPEPGRGMLRLFVRDVAALTESLKGAGLSVVTTGGAPVTLPQGPRVVIVRDLNNFYVQPMQTK